mmetsp:Transcript_12160/g.20762  ORF Transcript_12160/g.20762 Transcript_12160/m.20762 type:complete len:345 (+) Transcript_12160:225-1259(+)
MASETVPSYLGSVAAMDTGVWAQIYVRLVADLAPESDDALVATVVVTAVTAVVVASVVVAPVVIPASVVASVAVAVPVVAAVAVAVPVVAAVTVAVAVVPTAVVITVAVVVTVTLVAVALVAVAVGALITARGGSAAALARRAALLQLDELLADGLPRLVQLSRLEVGDARLVVRRGVNEAGDVVDVLELVRGGHGARLDALQVQLHTVRLVEGRHRRVNVPLLAEHLRLGLQLGDLLLESLDLFEDLRRHLGEILILPVVPLAQLLDSLVLLVHEHLQEVHELRLEAVLVLLLLRQLVPLHLERLRTLPEVALTLKLRHRLALGPLEQLIWRAAAEKELVHVL